MKHSIIAKAMLIVIVLGLSTFFGSLPTAQAGSVPSETHAINSQMDLLTPETLENQLSIDENEIMTSADIKAELDNIYRKDVSSYSNQLIVKFSSSDARDTFAASIQSGVSFTRLQTLPYVMVPNTAMITELLMETRGITRVTDDKLLAAPEYSIYEHEDIENQLCIYSSEGRIGAWDMHSLGYTGKGVRIAVLDTGIDSTHPDLMYNRDGSTKVVAQQSFVDYDFDGIPDEGPEDYNGHGTHVAGTTAGNGYQIGVAPDAFLLNAKVCGGSGCATSWMIEAVEWAILNNADIITMSIGGSTLWGLDPLDDLLDYAWQQGIVVTIAAGNDGPATSSVQSPGTGPRVITVAASDTYDLITAFSGRGPSVYGHYDPDIAAPGDDIFSTLPGATYGIGGGTSMATPHVAGAVALLLEAHPGANPDMIKANLMANAKDIGLPTTEQGAGLVDLVATHEEWSRQRAILFPTFNDQDILYLSPGETFSGYFSYINSRRDGIQPWFRLDRKHSFEIVIDRESMFPDIWKEFFCRDPSNGQQFIPFSVTAPSNAELGTQLSRDITAYFWKGIPWSWGGESLITTKMTLTIEIVQIEDDALTGTDAGDTFPGATEISFGTYSGYLSDIDFYKVWLEADNTYTFVLDGFGGSYCDYDLAIYNETGQLVGISGSPGSSPEQIVLTTESAGYYILRVDPWSLLIDPWYFEDTSGPYNLWMIEGGISGYSAEEAEVQVESLVTGEEPNSVDSVEFSTTGVSEIIGVIDYGLDTDGDTKFDYLVFDVNVYIESAGYYSAVIHPWFWSIADQMIATEGSGGSNDIIWLESGYHTLEIRISGELLNGAGCDGPFLALYVWLEAYDFGPYGIEFLGYAAELQNYETSSYSASDFDLCGVRFTQILGSNYLDLDGDGEAESIEVLMEFDVGYAGYFDSIIHFSGYPIDQRVNAVDFPFLYFDTPGSHIVPVILDGLEICKYEYQGLMECQMIDIARYDPEFTYVFNSRRSGLIEVDYTQLPGAKPAALIHSIADYGVDVDGNGLFDYLAISITVDVEKPGEFILDMYVWGDASTMYSSLVGMYNQYFMAYESGLLSIEFLIPASEIASNVFDDYTDFELWITLFDATNGMELDFRYFVYTDWYFISDFDVPWMYSLSYYTYDADGDFCDDTIDIFVDFAFLSLNDVTVDLYIDIWYYDEASSEYFYIGTWYEGFLVVENPSYFGTFLTFQAIYDGMFAFVPSIYIDGAFAVSEVIYWYNACTFNP
ncbi:hypothetical protein EU528_04910 [Candidatus Thorarchaeota archaeon]|nr:MAG: hypothetical protein EU528_04910 [Candidatus Thorarchaeota archaeon]